MPLGQSTVFQDVIGMAEKQTSSEAHALPLSRNMRTSPRTGHGCRSYGYVARYM